MRCIIVLAYLVLLVSVYFWDSENSGHLFFVKVEKRGICHMSPIFLPLTFHINLLNIHLV